MTRAPIKEAFTEHMVKQRIKQLEIGKQTEGYKVYISRITKRHPNNPEHPRTPDPYAPDSKRQFDGRVKAWRAKLKNYENIENQHQNTFQEMEALLVAKPNLVSSDSEDEVRVSGPVTLYACSEGDLKEAEMISRGNPRGSVIIKKCFDDWLEIYERRVTKLRTKCVYF